MNAVNCKFSILFKCILVAVTDVVSKQESADRDHSKTAFKMLTVPCSLSIANDEPTCRKNVIKSLLKKTRPSLHEKCAK